MWLYIKRLSLGIGLILLVSAILLFSDPRSRQTSHRGITRIAVFQFSSRPILDDGVRGVIDALAEKGFRDGPTFQIVKYNAENDLPTADTMAKAIVESRYNLVVTLSTPCLQVMASANRDGKIIHIFGIVTDPFDAGVGIQRDNPLNHPAHLAGIGTFQPVKKTYRLARRLYPDLKTVGVVLNPSEACSLACTNLAREVCQELGVTLLEAQVDNSVGVFEAANSLVARGAQALIIGGDNTVELAMDSVVKAARQGRIPVLAFAPDHAKAGALVGLGANYYEVGKASGVMAADVLNGLDPASVAIKDVLPQKLALNLTALRNLRDPWKITEDIRNEADIVIDEQGERARGGETPTPVPPLAITKKWNIHFLNYSESTLVEDCHRGFFDEIRKLNLVEGRDYTIKVRNAQNEMSNLVAMVDAAISDKADLILLTSTPTLQAALKKINTIPILFNVVANPILAGAGTSFDDHLPNVTGISTQSDYTGMARLLRECLPEAKRIGTLYVTSEDNSVYNRNRFEAALREVGMEMETIGISSSSEVANAAVAICSRNVDAVCPVIGNVLDASFVAVTRAARQSQKPLFSFTSGQVIKNGAAVAVSRDYEQAGRDMAHLMLRLMRGDDPAKIPFQLVSKTEIIVSPANATQCGWTLPPAILRQADKVVEP
jgi:ABC-type uncharacterized transport system substrate-binding protein